MYGTQAFGVGLKFAYTQAVLLQLVPALMHDFEPFAAPVSQRFVPETEVCPLFFEAFYACGKILRMQAEH